MKKNLVRDWMTPDPITIECSTTLPEAHQLLARHHIRRLPVLERGRLVGILTQGDVREASPSGATSLSISELHYLLARLNVESIMTREPYTIAPAATLREAAQLMLTHTIAGLPVVEDNKLVGIITESDIFRALIQEPDEQPERLMSGREAIS